MNGEWAADSNLSTVAARGLHGTHVVIGVADGILAWSDGGGGGGVSERRSRSRAIVSVIKLVVLLPYWVLKGAVCCVAQCFLPDSILYGVASTTTSKARMAKMNYRRQNRRSGAQLNSNATVLPEGGILLDGNASGIRPLPWAVVSTDISAFLLGEKMNIAATSFFVILEVAALWFISCSSHTGTATCTGLLWCLPTDLILLAFSANVAYGLMLSVKRVKAPFVGLGNVSCTCSGKECTHIKTAPATAGLDGLPTSTFVTKEVATTDTASFPTDDMNNNNNTSKSNNVIMIHTNQVRTNTLLLLRAADVLKRALDITDPRVALLMPADQHRRRDMDIQNRKASVSPTIKPPLPKRQDTHTVDIAPFGDEDSGGGGGVPLMPWQSATERLLDQYVAIPKAALGLPNLSSEILDGDSQERYGSDATYTSEEDPEAVWVLAVLSRFATQHEFQGGAACGREEVVVPSWLWCQYCCCLKPLRAKHCHTCGRCVHDQDHHCPWVGSCVGGKNLGQFLMLVLCMAGGIGRGVMALIQVSTWGRHVSMGLMQIQLLLILGGSLTFLLVCFPMAMSIAAITTGRTSYEIFRHTPYDRLLVLRSRIRKVSVGGGGVDAGTGRCCSPSPPWYVVVGRWYAFLCTSKQQDIERSSVPTCILGGCAVVQSHRSLSSSLHTQRRDEHPRRSMWGLLVSCVPKGVLSVGRRIHECLVVTEGKEGSLDALLDDIDSCLE